MNNNNNVDKSELVNSVFNKVYKKYDIMNDIMSLGVHRIWKKNLVSWMNPSINSKILDVAAGTGDMAKYFLKKIIIKILFIVLNRIRKC